MLNRSGLFLILVVFAHGLVTYSQSGALRDGDRVLFYGDSITAQRLYTRFVEDLVLTRRPDLHITFVNAGVPGDTVNGGYTGDQATRLKRDVFPHQPTVITIMLGMNDGYYVPFEQKYLDIYKDGYRALLTAMQKELPDARITLLTPTPYDEVTHGTEFAHYNEAVQHNAAFVKELAASSHLGFSDFYQSVASLAKSGTEKNASLAALLIPDRIHPAEAAHWVMAAELARNWGISPIVSRVSLDAVQATILEAENTHVSSLQTENGKLHWTQADNALPLPLPLYNGMIQFVLGISELAAMDQQILRVSKLSASHYKLTIDGHDVATFSRDQLATGVNLALYATPMTGQAGDVDGIEQERTKLDEAIFILTTENPKTAADDPTVRSIEAKDVALREEQRTSCQPKPHAFELTPE